MSPRVPEHSRTVDMVEDGVVVVRHVFYGDDEATARHMEEAHREADASLDAALDGKPYGDVKIDAVRKTTGGYDRTTDDEDADDVSPRLRGRPNFPDIAPVPKLASLVEVERSADGYEVAKNANGTGVMVAFRLPPAVARKLAVEGGEAPEDLHLTLAYLGKLADLDEDKLVDLHDRLEALAGRRAPVSGQIRGHGHFPVDGQDVFWAHFDSPELPAFRQDIAQQCLDAGLDPNLSHGFTPHVTLLYGKDEEESLRAMREVEHALTTGVPVEFDSIHLALGPREVRMELKGDPEKSERDVPLEPLPEKTFSQVQCPKQTFRTISELEDWAVNRGDLLVRPVVAGVPAVLVKRGRDVQFALRGIDHDISLDDMVVALRRVDHDFIATGVLCAKRTLDCRWMDLDGVDDMTRLAEVAMPVFMPDDLLAMDGDLSGKGAGERWELLRAMFPVAGGHVAVPRQVVSRADSELEADVDEAVAWRPSDEVPAGGELKVLGAVALELDSPYEHGENDRVAMLRTATTEKDAAAAPGVFGTPGTSGILAPQQGTFRKPRRKDWFGEGGGVPATPEGAKPAPERRKPNFAEPTQKEVTGAGTSDNLGAGAVPLTFVPNRGPKKKPEPPNVGSNLDASQGSIVRDMTGSASGSGSTDVGYGGEGDSFGLHQYSHQFVVGTLKDGQFVRDPNFKRVNPYEAIFNSQPQPRWGEPQGENVDPLRRKPIRFPQPGVDMGFNDTYDMLSKAGQTVAIDFDGTIARGEDAREDPKMRALVDSLRARKVKVVVFTARDNDEVRAWLREHGWPALEVTSTKSHDFKVMLDDRAVQYNPALNDEGKDLDEYLSGFKAWWEKDRSAELRPPKKPGAPDEMPSGTGTLLSKDEARDEAGRWTSGGGDVPSKAAHQALTGYGWEHQGGGVYTHPGLTGHEITVKPQGEGGTERGPGGRQLSYVSWEHRQPDARVIRDRGVKSLEYHAMRTDPDYGKTKFAKKLSPKQQAEVDAESEKIRENKKQWEGKPHDYKAAQWTHPNGHPRCIRCGDEEPIGGKCNMPASFYQEQPSTSLKSAYDTSMDVAKVGWTDEAREAAAAARAAKHSVFHGGTGPDPAGPHRVEMHTYETEHSGDLERHVDNIRRAMGPRDQIHEASVLPEEQEYETGKVVATVQNLQQFRDKLKASGEGLVGIQRVDPLTKSGALLPGKEHAQAVDELKKKGYEITGEAGEKAGKYRPPTHTTELKHPRTGKIAVVQSQPGGQSVDDDVKRPPVTKPAKSEEPVGRLEDHVMVRAEKRIRRHGDKYQVTTEDGSKVLGTHDTMAEAQAQLGAIESNKKPKDENASFGAKLKAEAPGSRVQTLIFDKEKYPDAKEAKAWANDHGFSAGKVDETGDSFRLRQESPEGFARMRTIELTTGVKAVIGFPKAAVKSLQDAVKKWITVKKIVVKSLEQLQAEPVEEVGDDLTIYKAQAGGHVAHFAVPAAGGYALFLSDYRRLGTDGYVTVAKAEEKKYTLGVVYPAKEVDFHGDTMTVDELEKAAWGYLSKADGAGRVGLMHRPGTNGAGRVVESYIYRGPKWTSKAATAGDPDQVVDPGDWLMGVIWNDEAWQAIKAGNIKGYSLQGVARKEAF